MPRAVQATHFVPDLMVYFDEREEVVEPRGELVDVGIVWVGCERWDEEVVDLDAEFEGEGKERWRRRRHEWWWMVTWSIDGGLSAT